jgi:CDP-glycerol glycerophosphotransferase
MKPSNLAKLLSPTRVLGALRRRAQHAGVGRHYRPGQTPIQQTVALFESFQGRNVGDNPLDVYLELRARKPELTVYWAVTNGVDAPAGALPVVWGSAEWLRLLASAKYLVNNANFPWFFRKAPGQIYLQTWHGTPLKRLGRDVPGVSLTVGYQATMEREAKTWDYLVAPNQFFVEVFPKSFDYTGTTILTGYPRNDRLSTADDAKRQSIREKFGVSDPAEKLVMYAPTWRDYKRTAGGNWDAVTYLNPQLQLPAGFRLMFRGHHNTTDAHSAKIAGNAIDATEYPDVTDLYIAADVLVTDYSSTMFDFSVTGKPMLFLAPDIDRYRAERGFYLDYEHEVPGPILKTDQELVAALETLPALVAEFAPKYASWKRKFNALEDGSAAKRVVDKVWGN